MSSPPSGPDASRSSRAAMTGSPPGESPRLAILSRNSTRSPRTSRVFRFSPSFVSQERLWSLPSTRTALPFFKYWFTSSACFLQNTTFTKQVSSFHSPFLSLYRRLTARPKLATGASPAYRTSGSRVRRPASITLLSAGSFTSDAIVSPPHRNRTNRPTRHRHHHPLDGVPRTSPAAP